MIEKRKSRALIALGANLPGPGGRSPLETCRWAAARLDGLGGFRLRALSRWYRSAPVDSPAGAPDFINGVAMLVGATPDPEALLAALHALEAAAGRERPFPNAPRPLDLDLIDLDALVREGPGLLLPHPRAHLRRFVLDPLADVAPGWVHPWLGLRAAELAAGLAGAGAPEPLAG